MELLKYILIPLLFIACTERDNPLDMGGTNYQETIQVSNIDELDSNINLIDDDVVIINDQLDTSISDDKNNDINIPASKVAPISKVIYDFTTDTSSIENVKPSIDCDIEYFYLNSISPSYEIDTIKNDNNLKVEINSIDDNLCHIGVESSDNFIHENLVAGDTIVIEATIYSNTIFSISIFSEHSMRSILSSDYIQGDNGENSEYVWVIPENINSSIISITTSKYPFKANIKSIKYIKKES